MGFGAIRSIFRPLSRTLVSRVAASCSSTPFPAAAVPAARPQLCSLFGGSRLPWIQVANHFHSLSLTDTRLPKRRPMTHPKKKRFKLKPPGPYAYVQYTPGEPIASNNPNKGSVKRRNAKKRIGQRRAFILVLMHMFSILLASQLLQTIPTRVVSKDGMPRSALGSDVPSYCLRRRRGKGWCKRRRGRRESRKWNVRWPKLQGSELGMKGWLSFRDSRKRRRNQRLLELLPPNQKQRINLLS